MGEDNIKRKYLFPNGRQTIDFIFEAGLGHGFCLGRAVQCRYKAGLATTPEKRDKLMGDCNWYIDQLSRRENIIREEVVAIVKSIVGKMERDRIIIPQEAENEAH